MRKSLRPRSNRNLRLSASSLGGLGLSGMQERALLIGAALSIASNGDSGTTVTLTMG